jgi:hypothetical protein
MCDSQLKGTVMKAKCLCMITAAALALAFPALAQNASVTPKLHCPRGAMCVTPPGRVLDPPPHHGRVLDPPPHHRRVLDPPSGG